MLPPQSSRTGSLRNSSTPEQQRYQRKYPHQHLLHPAAGDHTSAVAVAVAGNTFAVVEEDRRSSRLVVGGPAGTVPAGMDLERRMVAAVALGYRSSCSCREDLDRRDFRLVDHRHRPRRVALGMLVVGRLARRTWTCWVFARVVRLQVVM